ncbi:MAG: hypothetical protein U9N02_01185, partial [Campylobacterota bacterium]|nr:hypothetical protein [Campylobacterota bacterium]
MDNTHSKVRQSRTKKYTLNSTILSLCLKNKKEDKKSFQIKTYLHVEDRFISEHHITKTQKPT